MGAGEVTIHVKLHESTARISSKQMICSLEEHLFKTGIGLFFMVTAHLLTGLSHTHTHPPPGQLSSHVALRKAHRANSGKGLPSSCLRRLTRLL